MIVTCCYRHRDYHFLMIFGRVQRKNMLVEYSSVKVPVHRYELSCPYGCCNVTGSLMLLVANLAITKDAKT